MRTKGTSRGPARPVFTVGLSGITLFVLSFAPWWGSITTSPVPLGESGRLPGATGRFNAYFGYGWTLELAILLALALSVLAFGRGFSKFHPPRWLYFWIGLAMTALVLTSVIRGPLDSGFAGVAGIEVTRGPLVFVALFVCVLSVLSGIGYGRQQKRRRRS